MRNWNENPQVDILKYNSGGENMGQSGSIKIHLAELIRKSGLTKGEVGRRALMERTQLNSYCNNKVSRIDLDVIARLCTAVDCKVEDLLEFLPEEDNE